MASLKCFKICHWHKLPPPAKPILHCTTFCLPPLMQEYPHWWPKPDPEDGYIRIDGVKPEVLNAAKATAIISALVAHLPRDVRASAEALVTSATAALSKAMPEGTSIELIEHK